ncbi:MAG: SH3 domain-containing protein [Paracoccaceae bacterium]
MIRLLLLLCAGIFVTLQIGGQDRGQMRFGLTEAERELVSPAVADEPVMRAADNAPITKTSPENNPVNSPAIRQVVFAPAQPLISSAAQPETILQAETVAFAGAAATGTAVMYVTGRSVNVRSGPSTQTGVVGRLTRGEAVSVISVEDNGWARVRIEGDGIDGFMSMSFLAETTR